MVHRPRYDDWTLPKGKPMSGESTRGRGARGRRGDRRARRGSAAHRHCAVRRRRRAQEGHVLGDALPRRRVRAERRGRRPRRGCASGARPAAELRRRPQRVRRLRGVAGGGLGRRARPARQGGQAQGVARQGRAAAAGRQRACGRRRSWTPAVVLRPTAVYTAEPHPMRPDGRAARRTRRTRRAGRAGVQRRDYEDGPAGTAGRLLALAKPGESPWCAARARRSRR